MLMIEPANEERTDGQTDRRMHFFGGYNIRPRTFSSGDTKKKSYGTPSEQLFPNRWPLSYTDLSFKMQPVQRSTPKHFVPDYVQSSFFGGPLK